MNITKQATALKSVEGGIEYVLSDETVDRYGDVVEADGWQLANFRKNPVALFGHSQDAPAIGRWENLRIESGKLIGQLKLAARGTSQRIDEIISLIEQGILRAVSVGFKPLEKPEPMPGGKGLRYTRQELLETSVVNVPANPNAVMRALELNISANTLSEVFGEDAVKKATASGSRSVGKPAVSTPQSRGSMMNTISKRIEATQERIGALRGELETHLSAIGEEPGEDENAITKGFNEKIAEAEEALANFVEAEKRLASNVERTQERPDSHRKPFAVPSKKVEPVDYVFRAFAVAVKSHVDKTPYIDTLKDMYGEDVTTKAVSDIMISKAAVAPADTATSAWAGALVQTAIGDFFDLLLPQSVYPGLSARGGRFGFGRNGTISLPTRDATPTVAGSFVGEGAAIPVRRAGFSAVTLTPKKMAVITTMTREITERSTPAIEQLLRNAIQEDTAVSIDSVLLDNGAATAIRPAGLRNGITTAAGTAGGGIAAVVADLKGMIGSLVTATNGNLRSPVFLMNPAQALALSLTQNAGGDFPFASDIGQNRFQGYGVIQSSTVPAGVVILMDAADFFSATGDDPRFDVSDQATLHMEDTTPLAIGTAGAPNTVAAPVRSLFQTDSLALRMILPMNWAMRRSGVLVERTAVTW
jgi:HK97 family phage major capsid protein/HK97 family phage prohead protease